jgi:hypothetical protein
MTQQQAALEKVVRDLLVERFGDAVIGRVSVKPDIDSDGDRVLRVMVVIDSGGALDRKKLVGLVRHLRSRLTEENAYEFPLVSFVSKAEASKLKFATA